MFWSKMIFLRSDLTACARDPIYLTILGLEASAMMRSQSCLH